MFKKIALLAILMTALFTCNVFASGEASYYYDITIEIHGYCSRLVVGYEAQDGWHKVYDDSQGLTSGTYTTYNFTIPTSMYPANTIVVQGWGPYGAYDEDECSASLQYTNELELWIGCTPPGEEDPPE